VTSVSTIIHSGMRPNIFERSLNRAKHKHRHPAGKLPKVRRLPKDSRILRHYLRRASRYLRRVSAFVPEVIRFNQDEIYEFFMLAAPARLPAHKR
jgi:hypothetical protein